MCAPIDLTSGNVFLSPGTTPLRPGMTLGQLIGTQILPRLSRRVLNRHASFVGYGIGTFRLAGVEFFVSLDFEDPSSVRPVEHCRLTHVELNILNPKVSPASGWSTLFRSLCSDGVVVERETYEIRDRQIRRQEEYRRWLQNCLGQGFDVQDYPPWGRVELLRDDQTVACHIVVSYHIPD